MAKPGSKPGSGTAGSAAETRAALIRGAIDALRDTGYAGASAREIARRAGCNQALIFYHFGSVDGLLLAALDEVSAARLTKYQAAVQRSGSTLSELVKTARSVFDEDLDRGYVAVLAAMMAGAQSSPALGAEVAARLAPWREFAAESLQPFLGSTPLAGMIHGNEIAHAVVALYLGLEMLASLDGDRAAALTLFDRAQRAASLLDMLGAASPMREQR
jgi:AcrR family transcriptional regulator